MLTLRGTEIQLISKFYNHIEIEARKETEDGKVDVGSL